MNARGEVEAPPTSTWRPSAGRALVWIGHLALPMLGLWLLVSQPGANVRWEDHTAHFWLVALAGGGSVALALLVGRAAGERQDARLVLISLTFLVSAAFLGLHAVATPGVIVAEVNAGFDAASATGLVLGAGFAAAAALDLSPAVAARVVATRRGLELAVLGLALAWGIVSIGELPPLSDAFNPDSRSDFLAALAVAGCVLYALAAARFLLVWWRRGSRLSVAAATAFVLLGEALVAAAFGRNWQLSWWEWHLLMAAGFGYVLYAARLEARRDRGGGRVFDALALDETVQAMREEYGAALERYVDSVGSGGPGAAATAAELAERFDLTASQLDVLQRAGDALAAEREQIRRLGALVAVGRRTRVLVSEDGLLSDALDVVADALDGHALQLALIREGKLELPSGLVRGTLATPAVAVELAERAVDRLESIEASQDGSVAIALPLVVKERPAGALLVSGPGDELHERDRAILESLASQLSVALENVRLYREVDALFRSYLSPDVATALLADPDQAALGGARLEVTVLMADLESFTPFSERHSPEEVVRMLNTLFTAVVPPVLASGGTIVQFIGDALMALFGAPVQHADHARRAAEAALGLQAAASEVRREHPEWPRFRCGVNTGPALVGNVGAQEVRNFTAIGDTTNLAARLEGVAGPGEVVVGPLTAESLPGARLAPLGPVEVKGKAEPVQVFRLLATDAGSGLP